MIIYEAAFTAHSSCYHNFDKCHKADEYCDISPQHILRQLCQVSKSFCSIAQPLLFTDLYITSKAGKAILSRLKQEASRQRACKKLTLALDNYRSLESVYWDTARILKNVRCLHVTSLAHSSTQCTKSLYAVLMVAIANQTALEHLSITAWDWQSVIIHMINNSQCRQELRTLDVSFSLHKPSPLLRFDRDLRVLPRKCGTSQVHSITIRNLHADFEVLTEVISWPRALVNFSLTIRSDISSTQFPALVESLARHAGSLKAVHISYLDREWNHFIFDATRFPCLETLHVSRWVMHLSLIFTPEAANLLGPAVHTLVWDFDAIDPYPGWRLGWDMFGNKEEMWLSRLAQTAITHGAALRHIHVIFTPSFTANAWDIENLRPEYPWDRMDRVRDTLLGKFTLTYNKPVFQRDGSQLPSPT
jgi:hypothetical protein